MVNIGKKTIPAMNKTLYIGLAVCSHINNTLSEAVFDGWTITDKTSSGDDDTGDHNNDDHNNAIRIIIPRQQAVFRPVVFPNPPRAAYA